MRGFAIRDSILVVNVIKSKLYLELIVVCVSQLWCVCVCYSVEIW